MWRVKALEELRTFMIVNGVALKKRQKLMRNLRVCREIENGRVLKIITNGAINLFS